MIIKGKKMTIKQVVCLILYYGMARYLPQSNSFLQIGGFFRRKLCQHIFKKCGKEINIERGAWFGSGIDIEIGDFSGIGRNAHIPNGTIIGNYVMMGPNVYILDVNHKHARTDIPMMFQGHDAKKTTYIGNDVWIGRNVFMTPGRRIADHSIIGGYCVLTKDFPEYSIVGGNPSKLICSRI